MELTVWEIDFNDLPPKERPSLDEIFTWCMREHHVDRMLVALRLEQEEGRWQVVNERAEQNTLAMFGDYMLTSFHAAQWPGTELIGHPGLIHVLRFNEEVKDVILRNQPSLEKMAQQ